MLELVVEWLNILYLDKVIIIFLMKLTIDLVDYTVISRDILWIFRALSFTILKIDLTSKKSLLWNAHSRGAELFQNRAFREIICPINDKTDYTVRFSTNYHDNYGRERNLQAISLANLQQLSWTLTEYLVHSKRSRQRSIVYQCHSFRHEQQIIPIRSPN